MMTNTPALREQCARRLQKSVAQIKRMTAFIGLDGFVDNILHVVDKRTSPTVFQRVPTIGKFAERLAGAAGQSTNAELVTLITKLGGNGPIMSNALAALGLKVTYLGNLGYPHLHPVFEDFARRAEVHSIAEPGYTDALEFEDGKIMLGKHSSLKEVTWKNIVARYGKDKFAKKFGSASLVGFVNWTMLLHMSDLWTAVLREICPKLKGPRRKIFFDLADPEKRTTKDILRALKLIGRFQRYFDVILGLNEKEAVEIGKALPLKTSDRSPKGLAALAVEIHRHLRVDTLVVHPVAYAMAVSDGTASVVKGPYMARPLITTGAGDHFNSGFCLGKLLGFDNSLSVLTGVATSGYYVRTGKSPDVSALVRMLQNWPV